MTRIPSISMYTRNTLNSGLLSSMRSSVNRSVGSSTNVAADMNSIISQYSNFKANRSQLRSYYEQQYGSKPAAGSDANKEVSAETSTLQSKADSLKASADKLTTVGKDSLFVKDESGSYDMQKIADAVGSFVKDYNAVVSANSSSADKLLSQKVSSMQNLSSTYATVLNKVGISVGADNKLSLDTEKFKSADQSMVKALFNGSNSYAGMVSSNASQIGSLADRSNAGVTSLFQQFQTYNKQGYSNYTSSYMTGSLLDYMV